MSGALKEKLVVVGLFSLFASVVIGGMAWATVATYKLAKDEHLSKVRLAIWRMEKYLGEILAVESNRPYTDYVSVHQRPTLAVISSDGRNVNVNAALAVLPSPLRESGPPNDWIELYFQVDESGRFSSPQLLHGMADWMTDPLFVHAELTDQAHERFRWLTRTLSAEQLAERVVKAIARDITQGSTLLDLAEPAGTAPRLNISDMRADFRSREATEYQLRIFSKISSQMSQASNLECMAVDIVNANIQNSAGEYGMLMDASSPLTEIAKSYWATFWLESDECQCAKLAFVRTLTRAAVEPNTSTETERVFYQGFIADWNLLKQNLLARVSDHFPQADLLPVADDKPPSPQASEFVMSVPVKLSIPEMAGGASAAAWRSVGGMLVISWVATTAVLVLAGWGVWSLVALTQRRMRFAYAVTHELRTPLTTFRLYSDMLAGGLVPEGSKQQYLDTMNRESQRLSELVEGVLEYARIGNQKVRLNPVETDGDKLLGLIDDGLAVQCRESGIALRSTNHLADDRMILVDADVVSRIAGVLSNNARRHAVESDEPIVAIDLSLENGKLSLDVIDSGSGIDRNDARTIFKPFRRGRSADAEARGGIGLGLALARSWAKLLGGSLELTARKHEKLGGAHFRLTVPVTSPLKPKRTPGDLPDGDAIVA